MPLDTRSMFDSAFARESEVSDADRQRIAHLVTVLPRGDVSVLDAGCGPGHVARAVAATGREVSGMDLSPVAVQKVREAGLACVEAAIDAIPFDDASFDLVLACEVLEHLDDRTFEAAVRELGRVARHHVLLTVPNRDHLPTLRRACPRCASLTVPWGHVRSFSAGDLPGLLPGFRCELTEAFGPPVPDADRLVTRLLRTPLALVTLPLGKGMRCPVCGHVEERRMRAVLRAMAPVRAIASGLAVAATAVEARLAPTCPRWLLALYHKER